MAAPENRFLRPAPTGSLLRGAGWMLLLVSVVALSEHGQLVLFSLNGVTLEPALRGFFEQARLGLGVLGLALVASSRLAFVSRLPSPRRGDVVVAVLSGFLACVTVEAWLRARGAIEWGSATRMPPGVPDLRRDGESVLRPGVFVQQVASHYDDGYRRVVFFTINRYGLRGPMPADPKRPGRKRILCLGGSSTFGYTVSDGEEWPAQLAKRLGDGFEVLNAGRPGATTYADFSYLRDRLLRLEPDLVVLYEGFNDLWRGVRRHAGEQPDYGRVDPAMPPRPDPLDRGEPAAWPLRVSFLASQGAAKLAARLPPPAPPFPEPELGPGRFRFDAGVVSLYEHNLREIVRLCRRGDAVPVVATFAACDDPSLPTDQQERRLRYVLANIPQLDVGSAQEGMDLYREITRRVAREEGAPLVDLARSMTKDLRAYTDTIHFTPEGERRLAEQVAEALNRDVLAGAGAAAPSRSGRPNTK